VRLSVERGLKFGPTTGFSIPAYKTFSVKHFMALKWKNPPPYSPDLAPNNFWLFLKVKAALKG
jgi:hypothetical protein